MARRSSSGAGRSRSRATWSNRSHRAEDDDRKAGHDGVPEQADPELRFRRQALMGERAEGCQQQLPRRRGEGRTGDERRPFARRFAQLRPPEDQGREVQDRGRVEERDRQESEVRPQRLARQLGVVGVLVQKDRLDR